MGTATLDSLSKEIEQIKARNVFVEENKVFLLSTLTLPFIKEYWKKHFYSKKVV